MNTYYADKDGRFIGGSSHGVKPHGAEFETNVCPEAADAVYDPENDAWLEAGSSSGAGAAAQDTAAGQCQGVTKAGGRCKHKATHGNFCRQHAGQA